MSYPDSLQSHFMAFLSYSEVLWINREICACMLTCAHIHTHTLKTSQIPIITLPLYFPNYPTKEAHLMKVTSLTSHN